jgi:hypothetical protein
MLFDLLKNTPKVLNRIDRENDYFISSPIFLLLCIILIAKGVVFTGFRKEDVEFTILILLLGAVLAFASLYFIIPLLLSFISKLMGGNANKNNLRIVLALSLIPTIPALLLEIMNAHLHISFFGTQQTMEFIGSIFQLRILIIGLAHYNLFSFKHSAMVLITFYSLLIILGMLVK